MNNDNRSLLEMNPAMRFVVFFIMTGISLLLGFFISFSFASFILHVPFSDLPKVMLDPKNGSISLITNAFATIISFLIPSIAVAYFTKGKVLQNMGFHTIKNSKQVFYVILLSVNGLYLSGALASLTQIIPISPNLNKWVLELEETYKQAMGAITQMKSIADLFVNLTLVALVPAVVEELYFRGALQKTLKDWSGKGWLAVMVTAIIFSAFHFSFFGFLSRMALGIILGLIFDYTKTIWLPILLHFINNGVAIISIYLVRNDVKKMNQVMDEGMPIYMGAIAILVVAYILTQLKKTYHERLENDIH